MIKRVVYELQEELPNIKNFGTLSPIVGFRNWFLTLEESKIKNILEKIDNIDLTDPNHPKIKVFKP